MSKEKKGGIFSSKKFKYGSVSAILTAVFVAFVILFNAVFGVLADKYGFVVDLTDNQIYGIGDMHLAVLSAKLKARYGVTINLETPKIPYREKITKTVDIHARHKKQNGGSGQFGDVWIKFGPGEEPGLTFTVSVVGGVVPKNFKRVFLRLWLRELQDSR